MRTSKNVERSPMTHASIERMLAVLRAELPKLTTPAGLRRSGQGWRTVMRLVHDPLSFLCRSAQEQGDVVRVPFGPFKLYQLRHPDAVQRVLVDNNKNYDKQTLGYATLRQFLGQGLLTSEGEFWRRQRRIAQPAFHRGRIAGFARTMVGVTQDMLGRWDGLACAGKAVNIETEMSGLTLSIVSKTLLGTDITDTDSTVGRAVNHLNRLACEKMMNPLALPLWVPSPKHRRFQTSAAALDRIVYGIIEERRRNGGDRGDLLSMLMDARDEDTGEGMPDNVLRDEAMTIFLAGHETTANTLTWAFYLLSTHPDVRRRLQGELKEKLGERPPTEADLPSLPYLAMVLKESMRLYPPVWSIGRRCVDDDEIGGHRIEKNSLVMLSPWVTHRHADFWPNPEGFDPTRFEPEQEKKRPKYAYFPFGGGPRLCIGNGFAIMEAQLVLATVLQRYSPALIPGHKIEPEALITVRPKYGLPMMLLPA